MEFQHVDVFADAPFRGNSVTVFIGGGGMASDQLLAITREFRHFESIFLTQTADEARWQARVFDLVEELDFAGHPVLGAASVLHDRLGGDATRLWTIGLRGKTVTVQTTRHGNLFRSTLDQGRPRYGRLATGTAVAPVLKGISLNADDLAPDFEPAVHSSSGPLHRSPESAMGRTAGLGR
jgi:trans-2,3-dihydro-3-hydroxyanthranilate isomerase